MAIRSMTGYGTASVETSTHRITLDLRSVNGRFLEAQIKLPRMLHPLEPALREALAGQVGRGSLTVSANMEELGSSTPSKGAGHLAKLAQELRLEAEAAGFPAASVTLSDVLAWAGSRRPETEAEPSIEAFRQPLLDTLATALSEFDAFRLREGASLESDILARLDRIEEASTSIPALARTHLEKVRENLEARIAEYLDGREIDPARIAQEIGHMSERLDVQEEMTRLATHIAAFRKTIRDGGAVGKRIGFLLQEMLRETNTTGSKCQEAAITSLVISMKEELEAIREQGLNLE
ncbi:MAG: YicC family protein [Fibrobacteria bacterium]|nr:YicC family protein [Fibrobacteria bacterium]